MNFTLQHTTFAHRLLALTLTALIAWISLHVYRSLFKRSRVADALIQNTLYFSLRWNTSIASNAFFVAKNKDDWSTPERV